MFFFIEVLCESGNIGFSPEPHLHLEVHHVDEPVGPSVYFGFKSMSNNETFFPVAGRIYDKDGAVESIVNQESQATMI